VRESRDGEEKKPRGKEEKINAEMAEVSGGRGELGGKVPGAKRDAWLRSG
jgi:hypothetical protein